MAGSQGRALINQHLLHWLTPGRGRRKAGSRHKSPFLPWWLNMIHDIRLTSRKIRQRLQLIEPLVYRERQTLGPWRFLPLAGPEAAPPVAADVDDGGWDVIVPGTHWAGPDVNFVLRTRFRVPEGWARGCDLALYLPIGDAGDFSHPEALAYIDGVPLAACDRHHQEIILPQRLRDGQEHLLALHGWTGGTEAPSDLRLLMRQCLLVQIDQATRDFVATARVALGVADDLHQHDTARGQLYTALNEGFRVLDTRHPLGSRFYDSVAPAHAVLREGIARAGAPMDVRITAAGHAHIDVAWLWTLAQTRRKCGRTFHTVARLMERFPEFRFSQSQAQLYEFMRQDYPELFETIKQRVSEGRWEVLGGTWVEPDCNIPCGESLVRQLLLGRGFFREQFGEGSDSPVLWLPDVFGYAWSLPQLIKGAGLDYFFTIKLGWNQYNRLPYDSFWWQGLDGTRVLTHFSPTTPPGSEHVGTFNSDASPAEVFSTWRNFQQKDSCGSAGTLPLLMVYGYGDGGGGPTREMLENIREMESFPATPRLRCGSVAEFFRRLEEEAGDRLPTWNGELYLETHRGTYTTHSRQKRANRKSEFLLHDAEFLCTMATQTIPNYDYPRAELRRAWGLLCLNQFHDIIPGSSIGPVYEESLEQYREIRDIGERACQEALDHLAQGIEGDLLVVNPTSFVRRDLAFWPGGTGDLALQRSDGTPVVTQSVEDGLLVDMGELQPYSITSLFGVGGSTVPLQADFGLVATPRLLDNGLLRVEFDERGDIVRIADQLHQREVLASDAVANQFQAFEDRPFTYDAWDIDIFYDDKMWLAEPAHSVRVVEGGPLRACLEVQRRILGSEITQRISLARSSRRLDFDTIVQWRERHVLLKVAFAVDVLAPTATYDIQWGNVERPTHRNTSWDWARFETCAQKWVDLSERGYGVSLLNDCKYGHDIHGNLMRLSVLRGPTSPDPDADRGEHRFTYSLLPHFGDWGDVTIAQAYALNNPLLVRAVSRDVSNASAPRARCGSPGVSFFRVDPTNVVLETVKQAEDGPGLIVRLYESQRRRGECCLHCSFPLAAAWRTNLLEDNQDPLQVDASIVRFRVKPYEIVTLRLQPR